MYHVLVRHVRVGARKQDLGVGRGAAMAWGALTKKQIPRRFSRPGESGVARMLASLLGMTTNAIYALAADFSPPETPRRGIA